MNSIYKTRKCAQDNSRCEISDLLGWFGKIQQFFLVLTKNLKIHSIHSVKPIILVIYLTEKRFFSFCEDLNELNNRVN